MKDDYLRVLLRLCVDPAKGDAAPASRVATTRVVYDHVPDMRKFVREAPGITVGINAACMVGDVDCVAEHVAAFARVYDALAEAGGLDAMADEDGSSPSYHTCRHTGVSVGAVIDVLVSTGATFASPVAVTAAVRSGSRAGLLALKERQLLSPAALHVAAAQFSVSMIDFLIDECVPRSNEQGHDFASGRES